MTAVEFVPSAPNSAGGRAPDRALSRAELVESAVAQWKDELGSPVGAAKSGNRDPLLAFRDLKSGTLDLAAAETEARKSLLDGDEVLTSKLFPHEPLRSSALRSARALRDKSREMWEERGLRVCMLAVGIATWANPFAARRPSAPILLRPATITARDPAETDFVLEIATEPIVNPVLLRSMDDQLGLRFAPEDLRDPAGRLRYPTVVERLQEFAPAHVVDGFSIAHRAVLATFAIEPMELADDLVALTAGLETNNAVTALAGDDHARTALTVTSRDGGPRFRAFDLDDDQEAAVAAAADGSAVIHAPAGSGRTQTLAAIVAEAVGRGQSVLVVSPKRASLDDLVSRLGSAGLGNVVADVARTSPADVVTQITSTAKALAREGGTDAAAAYVRRNESDEHTRKIDAYRDAIHKVRQPWGISAYDAMAAVAATPLDARTNVRISEANLNRADSLALISEQVREYAELEGLTLTPDQSPWHGTRVGSDAEAHELYAAVLGLHKSAAPALRDAAVRAAVEVGLAGPTSIAECLETVDLLESIAKTVGYFGSTIWDQPLDEFLAATGDRVYRADQGAGRAMGLFDRRRVRAQMATQLRGPAVRSGDWALVHQCLADARDQLAAWGEHSRGAHRPRTGEHLDAAIDAAAAVRKRLEMLEAANSRTRDIAELPFADAGRRLTGLVKDGSHLRALPRLAELDTEIEAAGIGELLATLRDTTLPAQRVDAMVGHTWHASLLDLWCRTDSVLRTFQSTAHDALLDEFRAADEAVVRTGSEHVLAGRAANLARVAKTFEGQAAVLIDSQLSTQGPKTPRQLLETTPELALAAVPCWVTSPHAVASSTPPRQLFDVVVIDAAGQLPVAEAVPSIARGGRLVLCDSGDAVPTSFSIAAEPPTDPDEFEAGAWSAEPPYSVAAALSDRLPKHALTGQHRARDDRLLPDQATTSLPAAWEPGRLRLVTVEATSDDDGPVNSSTAEVGRVVELVLEHLRTRPHESLGVVTLGPQHAARLDLALRRELVRAPEVAKYLDEDRSEPFFVKDVDHVGDDVRDAIVLSLGYGRSVDGRILYRFGALGQPGGERRLVTAASRARERMTVVSTFGPDDLSPRRLSTPGAQALGEFLSYVVEPQTASGSTEDPLALAIAERLRGAGASVEVGYGGPSGVAVAVRHPNRAGRFVLAVEIDGHAYAAQTSTSARERLRRSRLRQLGWIVHQVWSVAWAADPDKETQRLVKAYEQATADADAYDWAVAAAEADIVAGIPDEVEVARTDGESSTRQKSGRDGERPPVAFGQRVADIDGRLLAAVARWVESDGASREEDVVVALLADELGVARDDLGARDTDRLRYAVRVARAGAPSHV